jgi:transposase
MMRSAAVTREDGDAGGRQEEPDRLLTDEAYARILVLIPAPAGRGRPRTGECRRVVEALAYKVRTGCAWRHLPPGCPPWPTVYGYYRLCVAAGVWPAVRQALARTEPPPAPPDGQARGSTLVLVDRHLAQGQARVDDQIRLVARLAASGHDTTLAEALLEQMQQTLTLVRLHRRSLAEQSREVPAGFPER